MDTIKATKGNLQIEFNAGEDAKFAIMDNQQVFYLGGDDMKQFAELQAMVDETLAEEVTLSDDLTEI